MPEEEEQGEEKKPVPGQAAVGKNWWVKHSAVQLQAREWPTRPVLLREAQPVRSPFRAQEVARTDRRAQVHRRTNKRKESALADLSPAHSAPLAQQQMGWSVPVLARREPVAKGACSQPQVSFH